ncbi:MAG: hypothetical protein LBF28_03340 [Rickettsiales bacterium]|jgi:hypothetical protein|nr:hypothetical protein [Rickettsiales bacterium]
MAIIDAKLELITVDSLTSNVLDFGAANNGEHNNIHGFVNIRVSAGAGTVKLQDSADNSTFADIPNTTVTVAAGGFKGGFILPAHKRYVKAVATAASSGGFVAGAVEAWIGADADNH